MADIIDTAAEIEELQRNAALSAHRIDHKAVSAENIARSAARTSQRRGGLPFPDARCVRNARKEKNMRLNIFDDQVKMITVLMI
ncbi:C4-type zinc finger protein [Enterobacter hormaechei]|jgi:hypothetical protein|nr:C4-type zinc finger protein [Enterobacter hormaechei]